jgi:hypothetical protein
MSEIAEWSALARDIQKTGYNIFATANVAVTDKGYADEKVLALTLLARTMSNLKSTLLLLDNRRVIEARVITRCCLENSFWVGCLIADGVKFTREMLGDETHHRLKRGQSLFASALPLGDEVESRLREWMRTHAKQFEGAKRLNPKDVAERTPVGRTHIFYDQLSSDACHPSLDALNRHVMSHTLYEIGGIDVDRCPTRERSRKRSNTSAWQCWASL